MLRWSSEKTEVGDYTATRTLYYQDTPIVYIIHDHMVFPEEYVVVCHPDFLPSLQRDTKFGMVLHRTGTVSAGMRVARRRVRNLMKVLQSK